MGILRRDAGEAKLREEASRVRYVMRALRMNPREIEDAFQCLSLAASAEGHKPPDRLLQFGP